MKSVILPLAVSKGARIFVQVDSGFPYTVLYNNSGPVNKRVIAVIDKNDEHVVTMPHGVDVRSLLIAAASIKSLGSDEKDARSRSRPRSSRHGGRRERSDLGASDRARV